MVASWWSSRRAPTVDSSLSVLQVADLALFHAVMSKRIEKLVNPETDAGPHHHWGRGHR